MAGQPDFPDLESDDKISVTTSKAERGEILDRDGKMLAGKGVATSVGIIPGKLEDRNVSIEKQRSYQRQMQKQ